MSTIFDRVHKLCQNNGISLNKLEEELHFGKNSLYGLKKSNPNSKVLKKIADYFDVSIDYLLLRTDSPKIPSVSSPEFDIKNLVNSAMFFDGKPITDDDKKIIQGIIEGYLNTRK
ncbi:helix-turn-helix transcriptional regulator [Streptococcus uberis]